MTFPADVKLVRVTCGTGYDFSGDPIAITLEVTPVLGGSLKRLIHAATGTFMTRDALTFKNDPGSPATFTVPSPAQAETWKDGSGAFFTNWSYSVTVTTRTASGKIQSWIQSFQPVDGQETVDLDLVPDGQIGSPTSAPAPAVTSVNGQSGAVVIDGGEAVTPESVAANLTVEAVDAKLPERLSESALSAAIDDSLYTAAGGTTTTGTNVRLAPAASLPSNVGTSGVIGGGHTNYENVIGGIYANVNTEVSNLGGPELTGLNGNWAWILGGYDNVVNGWACYVQGFHNRVGLDASHCTISGGSIHSMPVGTTYGTIGGGTTNEVHSNYSTVSGGRMNKATGVEATVLGGESNTASGNGSIAGGRKNVASGLGAYAVGDTNTASGPAGTVTGGTMNNATGDYSSVAGGYGNTASGRFTVASGRGAHANATGMKAHAGGSFSALGDAQAGDWILRRESTDATTTELFTENGFGRITLADGQSMAFEALIVAKSTAGESAGYKVSGLIERPAGSAAAAFIGVPTITPLGEDVAAWNVTLFAGLTDGTLRLQVTGEAGKTIRWVGRVSGAMVI